MGNGDFSDIAEALYRLRIAFAKHNIPCPDVLEYSDSRKAYEAMPALRHVVSHHASTFAMSPDAKPWVEMCLEGFSIRFEARKLERPGTGEEIDNGVSGRIFRDGF